MVNIKEIYNFSVETKWYVEDLDFMQSNFKRLEFFQ